MAVETATIECYDSDCILLANACDEVAAAVEAGRELTGLADESLEKVYKMLFLVAMSSAYLEQPTTRPRLSLVLLTLFLRDSCESIWQAAGSNYAGFSNLLTRFIRQLLPSNHEELSSHSRSLIHEVLAAAADYYRNMADSRAISL